MINIPSDYKNIVFLDKDFKALVEFFNKLERDLEYPQCKGNAAATRILKAAQKELIMWGKI